MPTGYGPAQQGFGQQPVYPQLGQPGLCFIIIIIIITTIIIISINISGYVAPEDKGMLGELGSGALNMVKTHHRRHHYRYRLCYSHRCHQSPPQIS